MRVEKRNFFLDTLLLLCLCIFIYAPSLNGEFVYDDYETIVKNPYIKDLKYIPSYFDFRNNEMWSFHPSQRIFYRPMILTSLAFNYFISGLHPFSYHLFNLILHLINVVLVYATVKNIGRMIGPCESCRGLALSASLLFACHPIQTETVSYVVSRSSLISTAFILCSFNSFVLAFKRDGLEKYLWRISSILCFVLSLLSKEIAIVVPLLMFSFAFVYLSHIKENKVFIGSLRISLPYFLLFAVYLFIRILLFNKAAFLSTQRALFPYFLTAVKGLFIYLRLIVFPVGQTVDHHLPIIEKIWEANAILGFAGFIGLILVSVFIVFPRSKCLFFGVAWFLIAMLPNLILPTNEPVSEHTMYFPSIGCFLIAGLVAWKLWDSHISGLKNSIMIPSVGFFMLIIVQLGILTLNRNIVWNDSLQLWADAVAKAPMKSRPHLNLGLAYVKAGKKDDARREYRKAISIDPQNYDAYNNLGLLFLYNGDYEAAQKAFEQSLRINGVNPDALNNIGGVYVIKRELDKAVSVLEKVLQIRPKDFKVYSNLGWIYIQKGNLEMACECLEKSIRLDPDYQASNRMYQEYCVKKEKDTGRLPKTLSRF